MAMIRNESEDSIVRCQVRQYLERLLALSSNITQERTVRLPVPELADYYYKVILHPDAHELIAHLISNDDTYFWYRSYETYDFSCEKERRERIVEDVLNVYLHKTRIIQKRCIISWRFSCEYFISGEWASLYSHSCTRSYSVPPISGSEHIYYSAPLLQACTCLDVRP